jgi:hypothetical protein
MTSSKAEEDVVKSYDRHANCYINKPVDLDEFRKVVQAIEDFWFTVVKLPPKSPSATATASTDSVCSATEDPGTCPRVSTTTTKAISKVRP